MSYVIFKTDGTVLTTINDGTINTSSTPLGLPGRLYPGYGQVVDTNFVHQLENFSSPTPPSNALTGQLWYNTSNETLNVCPSDGESNALNWYTLAISSPSKDFQAGNITASGNIDANNFNATNNVTANLVDTDYLTVNIQANIGNANVVGNLISGNALLGNSATANYFIGNLYGQANTAITAGTVTTNAQPNITSVGTLSSLTVSGNLSSGNANLGNLAKANFFQGDGGLLSNITPPDTSVILNGTSNVTVDPSGNVRTSVSGNANILVVTGTGANIAGTLNATGNANVGNIGATRGVFTNIAGEGGNISNIQGGNVSGAVSSATTAGTVTTAAQPNITSVGTLTGLGVNGNITAANITANTGVFSGNGSGLSQLAGGNVTGQVANALVAGTVYTAAQPNITSVGTLTSLTVSGNASVDNLTITNANGIIHGTGLLEIFSGNDGPANGSPLYIYTGTGTFVGGDLFLESGDGGTGDGGDIYITAGDGSVSAGEGGRVYIQGGIGNIGGDIDIVGGSSTQLPPDGGNVRIQSGSTSWRFNNQGNLVSTGNIVTTGNLTATNITANTGVFTGNGAGLTNIPGANVTGQVGNALVAGTVYTAAQPNITSVGNTLSIGGSNAITLANFTQSLGSTGYTQLPNGLLIQWGPVPAATSETTTTAFFAITFNSVYSVTATSVNSAADSENDYWLQITSFTTSQCTFFHNSSDGGSQSSPGYYIAIGT